MEEGDVLVLTKTFKLCFNIDQSHIHTQPTSTDPDCCPFYKQLSCYYVAPKNSLWGPLFHFVKDPTMASRKLTHCVQILMVHLLYTVAKRWRPLYVTIPGSLFFKGTRHLWFLSKTSILIWGIPTNASNNKPVKIWVSKLQENNERKDTLVAQLWVLSDA